MEPEPESVLIPVPHEFYCPISQTLMVDPVSDQEGNTYERSEILKWLSTSSTSPITRTVLDKDSLTSNPTVKRAIEAIRYSLTESQLKLDIPEVHTKLSPFRDVTNQIRMETFHDELSNIYIRLDVPDIQSRPPVDIALCIDISGSMGAEAYLRGDSGEKKGNGFSILSLTVYASKAIINLLNNDDNLSVIVYGSESRVLIENVSCSDENKHIIFDQLDQLKPEDTTNLWAGILNSLEVLRTTSPPEKMKSIFVLTDGIPNIEPPRGHEEMLRRYFKQHGIRTMINTFGFGYTLKSDLLYNISNISGGMFSFIPDSGILANILIQAVSNFLTTAVYNPVFNITLSNGLKFKENGSDSLTLQLNTIQYGQDRNIKLEIDNSRQESHNPEHVNKSYNVSVTMNEINHLTTNESSIIDPMYKLRQNLRNKLIELILYSREKHNFSNTSYRELIESFITEIEGNPMARSDDYITNILETVKGQVRESLNMTETGSRENWFSKWGTHYLLSLENAVSSEVCNNFKDKVVQNFGGEYFDTLREEMNTIFESLPPPKQDVKKVSYGGGRGVMRGGGASMRSQAPAPAPVDMRTYNSSTGPCCSGDSKICMDDSTFKLVEDIQKGDKVRTYITTVDEDGELKQSYTMSEIECVIKTKCIDNKETLVAFNDLKITPYHPVIHWRGFETHWRFPKDMNEPGLHDCNYIYSIVTKNRRPVIMGALIFATWGHNIKGDVIGHEYFGTDRVINDLKNFPSYEEGIIELTKDNIKRDDTTGLVCAIE